VSHLESAVRNCSARFTRLRSSASQITRTPLTEFHVHALKVRPVRTRARARVRFRGVHASVHACIEPSAGSATSPSARTWRARAYVRETFDNRQATTSGASPAASNNKPQKQVTLYTSPEHGTRRISSRGFRSHSLEFFLAHESTHAHTHCGRHVRNLNGAWSVPRKRHHENLPLSLCFSLFSVSVVSFYLSLYLSLSPLLRHLWLFFVVRLSGDIGFIASPRYPALYAIFPSLFPSRDLAVAR